MTDDFKEPWWHDISEWDWVALVVSTSPWLLGGLTLPRAGAILAFWVMCALARFRLNLEMMLGVALLSWIVRWVTAAFGIL